MVPFTNKNHEMLSAPLTQLEAAAIFSSPHLPQLTYIHISAAQTTRDCYCGCHVVRLKLDSQYGSP